MAKKPAPAVSGKPLAHVFIDPTSDVGRGMYERLFAIVDEYHDELSKHNAKIALAWCTSWKRDHDGRLTLGMCKKASELDRQLHDFDFVILLNQDFWTNPRITDAQRDAVMDHECMHMAIAVDAESGEPKVDATGRTIFRMRGHDLEEFRDIVARHGCYKDDIEAFVRVAENVVQRATGQYTGYSRVQSALKRCDIELSIDTIAAWLEADRREVLIWAELRAAAPGERVNVLHAPSMPGCLKAVLPLSSTDGDSTTAH